MDTINLLAYIACLGVLCFWGVIMASPDNMRKAAAWLIAKAQARDEIRKAKQGIEAERRIRQQDIESRLLAHGGISQIESHDDTAARLSS